MLIRTGILCNICESEIIFGTVAEWKHIPGTTVKRLPNETGAWCENEKCEANQGLVGRDIVRTANEVNEAYPEFCAGLSVSNKATTVPAQKPRPVIADAGRILRI